MEFYSIILNRHNSFHFKFIYKNCICTIGILNRRILTTIRQSAIRVARGTFILGENIIKMRNTLNQKNDIQKQMIYAQVPKFNSGKNTFFVPFPLAFLFPSLTFGEGKTPWYSI